MGPLKSPPSTARARPTSPPSTRTPPLRLGHHRLPPPPPPLSLPPPPPPPPGFSGLPLPSSSPPLPPPYDSLGLPPPPPSPPLPPPPPLPRDCSHLSRISSPPPLPPSSRALPMTTPRRGHPPWSRAAWEASLPTIVLGLACSSSTRLSREGHSVEQLAPARGSPPTTPFCADASGEDLAGVPPELLPPKKRPVRYHPYYTSSTIQEIATHGRGGGFGNRPVPLTVERDGDGFGNLPVPLNVEGDGDGEGEGFGNRPVPLTAEGDGDGDGEGFGNRPVPPTVERDGDGEGFVNRPLPLNVEGDGDGEGFGNRAVPLIAEGDGDGDGEGFRNRPVPLTAEGDGDSRQVDRDDEGLRAVLRRLRISQPALVLTKRLTLSDRSREHARLILPDGLVRSSPLLGTMTAGERHLVLGGGGLPVQAFDRLGRVYHMMLKRDRAANTYRLAGEWTLFLSRHRGMRDGDDVEVFAFRPPDWQARLVRCGEAGLGLALLHCRSAGAATTTANGMDWGGPEGYEVGGIPLLDANPARPGRLPRRRRRRHGNHNATARFA